jgi:hypothetical protein
MYHLNHLIPSVFHMAQLITTLHCSYQKSHLLTYTKAQHTDGSEGHASRDSSG